MPSFRLAKSATADLRKIGQYTKKRWGIEQARRYLGALDACFHRLAEQPDLGKSADDVRSGLRRQRQWHHAVFYRKTDYGVRIIRVLHERMLPERHLADDDSEDIE
jgi:toxin ParE1/3/4